MILPPCESLKSGVDGKSKDISLREQPLSTSLGRYGDKQAQMHLQERRLGSCRTERAHTVIGRIGYHRFAFIDRRHFNKPLKALVDNTAPGF